MSAEASAKAEALAKPGDPALPNRAREDEFEFEVEDDFLGFPCPGRGGA
jgi:hypothetical protein